MKVLILIAVTSLAIGVSVLFNYTQGTTGMALAVPIAGCSIHIDMTTTGLPMLAGTSLTLLGSLLLVVGWFVALVGLLRREKKEPKRREEPFLE
jgi:hypothetical protein